ncbi:MAG: hypothetical protein KAT65_11955 [Methanophagales archaeon]|jgi:hypothetical protein|nr:hypothetical protein [Methanophagales archaeon]
MDKEIFEMNREELEKWLIDNNCFGPLTEMEKYKKQCKLPKKFPKQCRNCWKVLVFSVSKNEALYIIKKYPHSKYLEMDDEPGKYLIVIYTKSEEERDNVRSDLESDNKVTGRIRYRFACRSFQDDFPEMFISVGKPNPKFL